MNNNTISENIDAQIVAQQSIDWSTVLGNVAKNSSAVTTAIDKLTEAANSIANELKAIRQLGAEFYDNFFIWAEYLKHLERLDSIAKGIGGNTDGGANLVGMVYNSGYIAESLGSITLQLKYVNETLDKIAN